MASSEQVLVENAVLPPCQFYEWLPVGDIVCRAESVRKVSSRDCQGTARIFYLCRKDADWVEYWNGKDEGRAP